MPPDFDLIDLIGDLYAAATDPGMWEVALRRLIDAFGSAAAYLFVIDGLTVTASQHVTVGLSDETMREYGTEFIKLCPRYQAQLDHPERKILYDYQHTPEEDIDRHPFYGWLRQSAGMRYYIGTSLEVDQRSRFVVTLQRTPAQGHVQPVDIDMFGKLLPHFERIVQIRSRLGFLDARAQALQAALDRLSCGLIVLDRNGVVASTNQAAECLLGEHDGLRVDKGILRASHRDDNQTLQAMVRDAVMTSLRQATEAGGTVAVRRPSGRRSYAVLVAPIPRREMLLVVDYPAALIFIMDPEQTKELPTDALRTQYGLSRAEAEVAIRLCAGMRLKDIADTRHISAETARTHLKRIFSKTGTRRQAELVRLLMQSVGEVA